MKAAQTTKLDMDDYLAGVSLGEALFRFASPELVRAYRNSLADKKAVAPVAGFSGLTDVLGYVSELASSRAEADQKRKNSIEALYRNLIQKIRSGEIAAYGFQIPRNLNDRPVPIPVDLFLTGVVDWNAGAITYRNMEFVGVRLIENIPIEQPKAETKSPVGNPIEESFSNLDPDLYIDENRAAKLLGLSPRTLQGYRVKGGGPPYVKISHKVVRYKVSDLMDWIKTRTRKNTSGP
jgi:predicted DNA-binding transcriptional regulator AlpA